MTSKISEPSHDITDKGVNIVLSFMYSKLMNLGHNNSNKHEIKNSNGINDKRIIKAINIYMSLYELILIIINKPCFN